MAQDLTFFGWQRGAGAFDATPAGGRLRATLKLEATSQDTGGTSTVPAAVTVDFYGPRDVTGLLPGAITHMSPAPGQVDAEETMCAYVELGAPDLPWRYAPVPRAGDAWQPWIVLVVGPTTQVVLQPGGRVAIAQPVLLKHPLQSAIALPSSRWAHVQRTNAPAPARPHVVSRLLSPYNMEANTDYLAVVVPAFRGDGTPSWNGTELDAVVPAYHSWRFRTGDAGDFKDLALRLRARAIDDPILEALGREFLEYPLADRANVLRVRSALVPPSAVPASGVDPDGAPPFDVAASVAAMRLPAYDAEGRHVIQLPRYGDQWVDDPMDPGTGWGASLNNQPRHRVAAGLGLWCGVAQQDLIADAAAARAGGLFVAAQRIRGLTTGIAAAESLWNRRLPGTPEARVALFGPALARVATTTSTGAVGSVLAAIADPANGAANGRPMPPAVLSAAARRVLRPRTARERAASDGALTPEQILPAANSCGRLARVERPKHAADGGASQRGLPHSDFLAQRLGTGDGMTLLGAPDREAFANQLAAAGADRALASQVAPALWPDLWRAVTAPGGADARAIDELIRRSREAMEDPIGIRDLVGQITGLESERPRPRCRPVDLHALDDALVSAFRPGREGVAARRVLDSIDGLDPAEPFAPPEICPDLDLPAWRFLRDEARDWLLFGRDSIQADDVVAVGTNARFINAFLAGLNTQALGELRWRNIPTRSGCTPLRRFWDRIAPATAPSPFQPTTDIKGIALWDRSRPLGDRHHAPDPDLTRQLVLVFKTPLFRRYPRTLVYLTSAALNGAGAPNWIADAPFTGNIAPVFTGEIDPDFVFFGFPVKPEDLASRWVVVEEPPPGYRFSEAKLSASMEIDGGRAAADAFASPTRVLFRGDRFLGEQP